MKKRNGFTLIELMLVIAILGILSLVAVPKFGEMVIRAKEAAIIGHLGTIRSAITVYYADSEGNYPLELEALEYGGKYLSKIPKVEIPKVSSHGNPGHSYEYLVYRNYFYECSEVYSYILGSEPGLWYYGAQENLGKVEVNCCHKRSNGEYWFPRP